MKSLRIYFITLVITIGIFGASFVTSGYFTKKKTDELKAMEDKIAIDILSFETQYELLNDASCKEFDKSELREELNVLESRLRFMESQVDTSNQDFLRIKRYYSLLQIKDYLLTKRMSESCKLDTTFIIYFYTKENCERCETQEHILRAVHDRYPNVEIYSFDFDLDLSAIQTLITLHRVPRTAPMLDINGTVYQPFNSLEEIEAIIAPKPQTAATSTKAKATPKPSPKR